MKKRHSAKTVLLAGTAMALVLGAAVSPSLSYFTTYVSASGSHTLNWEEVDYDVHEEFSGNVKQITLKNTSDTEDCYVRMTAVAAYELVYGETTSAVLPPAAGAADPRQTPTQGLTLNGWTYDNGYWYYAEVLAPGAVTKPLCVWLKDPDAVPGAQKDVTIVVNGEATAVFYDYTPEGTATPKKNDSGYIGWQPRETWPDKAAAH